MRLRELVPLSLSSPSLSPSLFPIHRPIRNPNCRKIRHCLAIRVRIHRHALLAQGAQQFEVVDVVGGREGVEELGLLVERVGEGVRRARRHRHVVARLGVDDRAVLAVEAQRALGHEEGLIVHFMPLFGSEEEKLERERVKGGGVVERVMWERRRLWVRGMGE
jgi:hypothetical protein